MLCWIRPLWQNFCWCNLEVIKARKNYHIAFRVISQCWSVVCITFHRHLLVVFRRTQISLRRFYTINIVPNNTVSLLIIPPRTIMPVKIALLRLFFCWTSFLVRWYVDLGVLADHQACQVAEHIQSITPIISTTVALRRSLNASRKFKVTISGHASCVQRIFCKFGEGRLQKFFPQCPTTSSGPPTQPPFHSFFLYLPGMSSGMVAFLRLTYLCILNGSTFLRKICNVPRWPSNL